MDITFSHRNMLSHIYLGVTGYFNTITQEAKLIARQMIKVLAIISPYKYRKLRPPTCKHYGTRMPGPLAHAQRLNHHMRRGNGLGQRKRRCVGDAGFYVYLPLQIGSNLALLHVSLTGEYRSSIQSGDLQCQ